MALRIYGASDDLVEVEGHFREEYQSFDKPTTLRLSSDDGEMLVTMALGRRGCWDATISMPDEDAPTPWPIRVEFGTDVRYSVTVVVDCGDDVTVEVES